MNPNNTTSYSFRTALHSLVSQQYGRRCDEEERALLHLAVAEAPVQFIELLIRYGDDIDASDSSGSTPLIIAAQYHKADIVRMLLHYNANVKDRKLDGAPVLHYASTMNDSEIVQKMIDMGADVDVLNRYGKTSLTFAESCGLVTETLLDCSARVLKSEKYRNTLLMHSARYDLVRHHCKAH